MFGGVAAGGILECVVVHGMRHYASAADETPFKAVLLSVWAQNTPILASKTPSSMKASGLVNIVHTAIGAANIMVFPRVRVS